MSVSPVWIASYGKAVAGAAAVHVVPRASPGAVEHWIVGYGKAVAGATPVWVAGYGKAVAGSTAVWIGGYGVSGGASAPTSVWSAADATANGMTLSNGGLTVTQSGAGTWQSIRGTIGKTSGKLYVEFKTSAAMVNINYLMLGLASSGFNIAGQIGASNYSGGFQLPNFGQASAGFAGGTGGTVGSAVAANDVISLAVDFTGQQLWIGYNNTWISGGNPATGVNPSLTFVAATVGALFPSLSYIFTGSGVWTLQPTAASQKYAPPSGFSAWG